MERDGLRDPLEVCARESAHRHTRRVHLAEQRLGLRSRAQPLGGAVEPEDVLAGRALVARDRAQEIHPRVDDPRRIGHAGALPQRGVAVAPLTVAGLFPIHAPRDATTTVGPNRMGRKILFITTDQQRYDALGCNGGR